MAGELDAHEVIDLTLEEVGPFPDGRDRRHGRIVFRDAGLEPEPVVARQRLELVDHLEPVLVLRVVHREDVGERSEEHTSELQSQSNLVCRLLLEKKKKNTIKELCEV